MASDTPTHVDASVAAAAWRRVALPLAAVLAATLAGGPNGFTTAHADGHSGEPSGSLQALEACPDGVPRAGFPDAVGNAHEANIDCVSWYEIARGTLPGAYTPARPVRRDQMASFVARTLETAGVTMPTAGDQGFTDIDGNTHSDRINQLAELGIVAGTSASTYSPAQPVRRDQMASFLVRAYEHIHGEPLDAPPSPFTDTDGNHHATNIDKASAAGFARGTTATTYSPAQPVRRDQMASFLARVLDRGADDGHVRPRQLPPPELTDATPLHARTVGLVEAGMTLAEVEQRTTTPVEILEFETFGRRCYYAQPEGVTGYSFMVVAPGSEAPEDPRDGIVARVSSTLFEEPHTPTVAGVRPGDPRAAVVAAYGAHQLEESAHLYQPGGVYLDVVAADGEHGLRFEVTAEGVVEAIHAGYADAIIWPEGCA